MSFSSLFFILEFAEFFIGRTFDIIDVVREFGVFINVSLNDFTVFINGCGEAFRTLCVIDVCGLEVLVFNEAEVYIVRIKVLLEVDFVFILVKDLDVKTECLEFLDEYLEGLGNA